MTGNVTIDSNPSHGFLPWMRYRGYALGCSVTRPLAGTAFWVTARLIALGVFGSTTTVAAS